MRFWILTIFCLSASSCCFYAQCDGPGLFPCQGEQVPRIVEREFLRFDTSQIKGFDAKNLDYVFVYKSNDGIKWTDSSVYQLVLDDSGYPVFKYRVILHIYSYIRIDLKDHTRTVVLSSFNVSTEEGSTPKGECCNECVTRFYSLDCDGKIYEQNELPIFIQR